MQAECCEFLCCFMSLPEGMYIHASDSGLGRFLTVNLGIFFFL